MFKESMSILHRENRSADNRAADQHLHFRYIHVVSTISPLLKSEISSLLSSVVVQPGLCRTWSETPKTGFLVMWLIFPPSRKRKKQQTTIKKLCPYC